MVSIKKINFYSLHLGHESYLGEATIWLFAYFPCRLLKLNNKNISNSKKIITQSIYV